MKYVISHPRIRLPVIRYGEKRHDRDYDRDHEYDAVMGRVKERVKHHPDSWKKHLASDSDGLAIVDMEHAEFTSAVKAGSKSSMERELEDLAAACICALYKMKSM